MQAREEGADWKIGVNTDSLRRPGGARLGVEAVYLLDLDGTNAMEHEVEERDGAQSVDITGVVVFDPVNILEYEVTTACKEGGRQLSNFLSTKCSRSRRRERHSRHHYRC